VPSPQLVTGTPFHFQVRVPWDGECPEKCDCRYYVSVCEKMVLERQLSQLRKKSVPNKKWEEFTSPSRAKKALFLLGSFAEETLWSLLLNAYFMCVYLQRRAGSDVANDWHLFQRRV